MKKLSSSPITMAEALDMLKKRKKQGELGYEQDITFELLKKTTKLSLKDAEKLKQELGDLGFLKDWMIVKIIDIVPGTEEELRAVFEKQKAGLKKQNYEEILKVVEKYL